MSAYVMNCNIDMCVYREVFCFYSLQMLFLMLKWKQNIRLKRSLVRENSILATVIIKRGVMD